MNLRWRGLLASGILAASLLVTAPSPAQEPVSKPNILVVITDDQRAGETMAVMPKTREWLPIDYPQAYATTPLCCPSRSSIFTGQFAHTHGVTSLGGAELDHSTTLQRHLGDAGYERAFFGKFLTAYPTSAPLPEFDRYAFTGFDWRYYDATWGANVSSSGWPIARHQEQEVSGYSTSLIGRFGTRFIEQNSDKPWLMYLSTHAPHLPYTPQHKYANAPVGSWAGNPGVYEAAPRRLTRYRVKSPTRWLTKPMTIKKVGRWIVNHPRRVRRNLPLSVERVRIFERDLEDKPPYIRNKARETLESARYRRAQQLRTLMSVDDMVDRVMNKLDETGQLDNTLVLFVSDNGYMWGEHGRRGKLAPYRESIQVPMRARFPGLEPKNQIVANIDIAPTAMEVAGLSIPEEMDGQSLLEPGWPGRSQLLTEHWCWQKNAPGTCLRWASVRHVSGWQYIENYDDDGRVYFREYYRRDDPWQLNNTFRDGKRWTTPTPERVRELHDWIASQGYVPLP